MRIVCWQTILMNYHTLFFPKIKKDVAKFLVCSSHDCFLRVKAIRDIKILAKSFEFTVLHN